MLRQKFFLFRIKFDAMSAARTRDSVIKHVYTQLFRIIIDTCNIGSNLKSSEYIAILDIAGFGMWTKILILYITMHCLYNVIIIRHLFKYFQSISKWETIHLNSYVSIFSTKKFESSPPIV